MKRILFEANTVPHANTLRSNVLFFSVTSTYTLYNVTVNATHFSVLSFNTKLFLSSICIYASPLKCPRSDIYQKVCICSLPCQHPQVKSHICDIFRLLFYKSYSIYISHTLLWLYCVIILFVKIWQRKRRIIMMVPNIPIMLHILTSILCMHT